MNESIFGPPPAVNEDSLRQPIGPAEGRYRFFKVRRYGKLHFEKRVADAYLGDLQTVDALRKEFELGYGLDHPAIVRYLAQDDNAIFEEFIDGRTLREMIDCNDSRLRDDAFLRETCRQLLEALDYLHRKGIVHLDIKPENVMITSIGNQVKIIDLGSARSAQFDRSEGFTPAYMAPEQAQGMLTDPTTDIYLLGRLMSEIARGNSLWHKFIATATASEASRRFRSCQEAITAIPEKGKGRRGRLKAIGLGVVVVGLMMCLMWLWRTEDSAGADSGLTEFRQAADLIQGRGTPQDEAEGVRLMMIAAEKGNPDAQCYIGLAYRDGSATLPVDPEESLRWIRRAADGGNIMAIEEMGYKYYEGFGVEQDYAESLRWLSKAAELGKSTAFPSLGIMYRDGLGTAPDLSKAEEYFLRGANAGNSYSAYLLARLYTLQKPEEALIWFIKASDMGSHRATEFLRDAYRDGNPDLSVLPDPHLAAKYAVRLESADGQ